jgi:hypothetical protein
MVSTPLPRTGSLAHIPPNHPHALAALLIAPYHATPLLHTCPQARLRARVWLVPGELRAWQLALMRARAALRVSSGVPVVVKAVQQGSSYNAPRCSRRTLKLKSRVVKIGFSDQNRGAGRGWTEGSVGGLALHLGKSVAPSLSSSGRLS